MRRIQVFALALAGGALILPAAAYPCIAGRLPAEAMVGEFRWSSLYEQWVAVGAFFGIKAIYTVLTVLLLVKLWRNFKRRSAGAAALWWGLLAFFAGEAACAINVLAFGESSMGMEYLHGTGMVLFLGFLVYGSSEILDARLLHYTGSAPCALAGVCRGCIKQGAPACGIRRIFIWVVAASALLAAWPLCADIAPHAYATKILRATHIYQHFVANQWHEWRFLPLAAIALFLAALARLILWEVRPGTASRVLFAAGMGALLFSLLRLAIYVPFADHQVWFAAWEEATELLLIGWIYGLLEAFPGMLPAPAQEAT